MSDGGLKQGDKRLKSKQAGKRTVGLYGPAITVLHDTPGFRIIGVVPIGEHLFECISAKSNHNTERARCCHIHETVGYLHLAAKGDVQIVPPHRGVCDS